MGDDSPEVISGRVGREMRREAAASRVMNRDLPEEVARTEFDYTEYLLSDIIDLPTRVGAFDNRCICWYKVQHGCGASVPETLGTVRDGIRRNGDLAGAGTGAR